MTSQDYIKTTSSTSPNCTLLELIKQRVALISVLPTELRWQNSSVSVGCHKQHTSEWKLETMFKFKPLEEFISSSS